MDSHEWTEYYFCKYNRARDRIVELITQLRTAELKLAKYEERERQEQKELGLWCDKREAEFLSATTAGQ